MSINYFDTEEPKLDWAAPVVNVSSDAATTRAEKIDYTLGDKSPGVTSINNQILTGGEDTLREAYVKDKQTKAAQTQLALLGDLVSEYPATPDAVGLAHALTTQLTYNPKTVIEKDYAEKMLSDLYFTPMTGATNSYDQALVDLAFGVEPEKTNILMDIARDNVAWNEVIQKEWEDLGLQKEQMGPGARFGATIENFIPFTSWYNLADSVDLLGHSLADQARELYSLPIDKRQQFLHDKVQELAKVNINDAITYLSAMQGYGGSDEFWGNAQSFMDVADILPIGFLAKSLRKTVTALSRTTRPIAEEVIASTGKTVEAATARLAHVAQQEGLFFKSIDELAAADPTGGMKDLIFELPSFANPFGFLFGESFRAGAREFADRIAGDVLKIARRSVEGIADRTSLMRLGNAAIARGVELAANQARKEFVHINDAILDIAHVPSELSPVSNIDSVKISFGKPSAELFDTAEQAEYFAKVEYKLPQYQIENQGEGWSINVYRDIDETEGSVRDLIIETGNTTPQSWVNSLLGSVRSSADLLPSDVVEANKVMVHGIQEAFNTLRDIAKPIIDLPKLSREKFQRFTTEMRDFVTHRGTEHIRGRQFNTLAEFEEQWVNNFGILPTEAEATAYYSYIRLGEYDWMLRNISLYSEKARQGIRKFSILIPNKEKALEGRAIVASDIGKPAFVDSPQFEGKVVTDIPDDAGVGILVWNPEAGVSEYHVWSEIDSDGKAAIRTQIAQNGSIIQVASPYSLPLKESTGTPQVVHFVVTPSSKSERLSFHQIPFRPGGHVAYDYGHYVKQPKVLWTNFGQVYLGDTAIRPANTSFDAVKYAEALDEARKLLKAEKPVKTRVGAYRGTEYAANSEDEILQAIRQEVGDEGIQPEDILFRDSVDPEDGRAFDAHVRKNLPESPEELRARFRDGQLSLDHPIVAVLKGRSTVESDTVKQQLGSFVDSNRDNFNLLRDVNKEFAGERDMNLDAIETGVSGSEDNPLFQIQAPRLIDPLSIANRAAANLARNGYLNDYRKLVAEHFIEEFGDKSVLKVPKEVLRNNPIAYLLNPPWVENAVDTKTLQAAKNFQRAFRDLMGMATPTQRAWIAAKAKLEEGLIHELGRDLGQQVSDQTVSRFSDPATFARKVAFNLKLGLFNPVQLFKQVQTLTHITALTNPLRAAKATSVYFHMRALAMSNGSEQMRNWFAKQARVFGWSKEDFLEAYDHMQSSGILRVEGEHAWSDDMLDPRMYTRGVGKFLDKGQIFFREGERITRIAGFNAAYLEWKAANKGKVFDRKAFQSVMKRQDDLTVNMTRATNAHWQQVGGGILNIPTQFMSYQIRLFEQMLGGRLTLLQKAKALATYSAVYGVPVGVGGTIGGFWPWYEDIRQGMLERGVEPAEGWEKAFHEGLLGMMTSLVLGNDYDVASSYGPSGLTWFKDILTRDASFFDIVTGAPGGTFEDLSASTVPLLHSLKSVFYEDGKLPVLGQDFLDFTRNISTVNNAMKIYYGFNIGKYYSKNGKYLDDITPIDGILSGALGINTTDLNDIGRIMDSQKAKAKAQDFAKTQIVKYLQRGFDEQDQELQLANFKEARKWLIAADFDPTEFSRIFQEATKGRYQSLVQSLNWNFFFKNPPPSQAEQRRDFYIRNK